MLQNPSTAPETRVIKQLLKRLAIMLPPKVQYPRMNEEKVERAMKNDKIIQYILKLGVAEGKARKVLTKQFQTYNKNFNDICCTHVSIERFGSLCVATRRIRLNKNSSRNARFVFSST